MNTRGDEALPGVALTEFVAVAVTEYAVPGLKFWDDVGIIVESNDVVDVETSEIEFVSARENVYFDMEG
jgi:hypothetical protein